MQKRASFPLAQGRYTVSDTLFQPKTIQIGSRLIIIKNDLFLSQIHCMSTQTNGTNSSWKFPEASKSSTIYLETIERISIWIAHLELWSFQKSQFIFGRSIANLRFEILCAEWSLDPLDSKATGFKPFRSSNESKKPSARRSHKIKRPVTRAQRLTSELCDQHN